MVKIKPNEPCPCKSGRKYKKCCASKPSNAAKWSDPIPEITGTPGLEGMHVDMTLVRVERQMSENVDGSLLDGRKGIYRVFFVLSRPNRRPMDENHFCFDVEQLKGDSHIFIGNEPDSVYRIEAESSDGKHTFVGHPNESGFLSKIEIERIYATNFLDATIKTYNLLCPILSEISVRLNLPFDIYQTIAIETSSGNLRSGFSLPFQERAIHIDQQPRNPVFSKLAGLYREALTCNSANYQFLCYYKIIEGVKRIRNNISREENELAKSKNESPPRRPVWRIPTESSEQRKWLSWIFGEQTWSDFALIQVFHQKAVGRKVTDLINSNKELDMIRNKIAHAILRDESQETVSFDNGYHMSEVVSWLPLCKCLAIFLMRKQFPEAFEKQFG